MRIKDFMDILLGSSETAKKSSTELQAAPEVNQPEVRSIPDDAVVIVPMRDAVLFPQVVLPLVIGRKRSIPAVQLAVRTEKPVGLLLQLRNNDEEPGPEDLYPVGTLAEILRYVTGLDGNHHIICQGLQRFRVKEFLEGYPFLVARIDAYEELDVSSKDIDARVVTLKQQAAEVMTLSRQVPAELVNAIQSISSPSLLTDLVTSYLIPKLEEKQQIF
jgi:ATP-dependent Lon protease